MINKHLIDPMDLSLEELDEIFELAHQIIQDPKTKTLRSSQRFAMGKS